jgi:hypothetical protein
MRSFVDNAGRTWTVAINTDTIKRVRALLKEDLLDVQAIVPRLTADPILLCDVLYCVCKPEADARGINDADFAKAMWGDAIAHAEAALMEELNDFFPKPKDRELFRLVRTKFAEMMDGLKEAGKQRLEKLEIEEEVQAAFRTLGGVSMNLRGSSESIQAPTPGGN